jgi:hypothetical protein
MAKKKPARRSALDAWPPEVTTDQTPPAPHPPSPLDLMLSAEPKHRDRGWDRCHRAWSYKIPEFLRQRAEEIRDAITGIAQSGPASTDEIASALISLALSHVERGTLTFRGYPDPRRQKMTVIWEETEGKWPQEIPPKKIAPKKQGTAKKSMYLAYRWPGSVHQQICRISGDTYARGEVIVGLLQHSLDAYRQGNLRLKFQPRIVKGEWS